VSAITLAAAAAEIALMRDADSERRRRFEAAFASRSADIVACCGRRAGSASDARSPRRS
jgi:hypothetical protein